ncbi:MAG: esterase family protein [Chitinophagaceae bacterium]|nr:esterase family protein [Chitinophagaceae bacterium]MCW5925369.1 esterase family protein [Chitinophagaceae bacterium]
MYVEKMSWYSHALGKDMPVAVYGHYGFALLLVPTAAADFEEYERFQLIDALTPFIDAGKIKVFSINSINTESWLNDHMEGAHKAIRQNQFNEYVFNEVVPYIKNHTSWETPIIVSGASFGALHSMNLFLKRPDLFNGVIAMSGVYDLTEYTKGYYDEQVYYNSPIHYIPNLTDEWYLNNIRAGKIIIATGSGAHEDPQANKRFSGVLAEKNIPHELDIWGEDITHDWPTWRKMLPHFIGSRF